MKCACALPGDIMVHDDELLSAKQDDGSYDLHVVLWGDS